ncbi:MAG TPA: hypothetical protein VJH97_01980, partial [Candidatus Nanoarchaeia archaeon]|nr:hypothetical protein [Candidatus Nanoarchaeia archaeon]
YANSPVNDSNFDTATNYEDAQFWIPSASGTVESHQLDEVSLAPNERFWFAIKAVDDSALESNVSNTDDSLSPFHNVVVETAGCINNKNKLNCTDTTIQNTNYLYDIINVSGIINNTGNVNESVEVKLLRNGVELIDSKFINISANSSVLVTDLEWNASQPGSSTLRLRTDIGGEEYKNVENVEVWSIKTITDLVWHSSSDYPAETGITSDEIFRVRPTAGNSQAFNIYDLPITIGINGTFGVFQTLINSDCGTNMTCYIDVTALGSRSHIWEINPLPAGTYNISVKSGLHPLDQHMIDRTITITDP